jgi:protein-tyrosine phosphatase
MAQALLGRDLPGVQVRSAGLGALIGHPADPTAIKLMQEEGLDIREHRATQVTRDLCTGSDLVFVMDDEQRTRLEAMYPQVRGRVFRIGRFVNQDVPDPYRRPELAFRTSLSVLKASIGEWLPRIRQIQ